MKSLWTCILILNLAAPAGASEFIDFYKSTQYPTQKSQVVVPVVKQTVKAEPAIDPIPDIQPRQPIVVPEVRRDTVADVAAPVTKPVTKPVVAGETNFNDYMPVENDPVDNSVTSDTTDESDDTGEVVNNNVDPVPVPIPRPRPRPVVTDDKPDEVVTAPTPTPVQTSLYDLSGCDYRETCWNNRNSEQIKGHMKKIIANVATVNQLHGTHIDPRYLLCTGWRESTYNPGAVGSRGEKGMFQVMASTASASLNKGGPPKLEEFKNYRTKASTYLAKMANSTLAQTEMAIMVLKTKVKESRYNLDSILTGNASVETYKKLAHAYNGLGGSIGQYAQPIANCLSCLRAPDGLPDVTKDFNYTSVDGCLAMAKK